MNIEKIIYAATYAVGKRLDFETLSYSDEMYGNEDFTDDVWEYVVECDDIGKDEFREKYSEYKFYCGF